MISFFVLRGKVCPVQNPSECADDLRLWRGVGGSPRHGRTQRLAPDAASSPGPPESKFQVRPRARAALCCPEHRLRAQIGPCTPAGAAASSGELPRRSIAGAHASALRSSHAACRTKLSTGGDLASARSCRTNHGHESTFGGCHSALGDHAGC